MATVTLPAARDPRWAQLAALSLFCVLGQTWLGWSVTPLEIALSVGTAVAVDVGWTRWRGGRPVVPLSALITGLGIAMLLRSSYPLTFVLAAGLAIASKHLIRRPDGRHRFNPSNFGLVATLALTNGLTMVTPGQWGTSGLVLFAVVAAGALVVSRAGALRLSLLYLASYVAVAPLFHHGGFAWSETLGGEVLAFAFFTVTDPQTAPRRLRDQVWVAPVLALVGAWLMAEGQMAGIFVAPFLLTAVRALGRGLLGSLGARPATTPSPTPRYRPTPG